MGKKDKIDLGDYFNNFIEALVESERYGTSSEVIRAGLRLLEVQEAELAMMHHDLAGGGDEFEDFDIEQLFDDSDIEGESH